MITLEKQLAKTDLNVFKMRPLEHLAKEIARYKDWTTPSALDRINFATLSRNTAGFYFDNGVRYLNGQSCTLSKPMKEYLDKYSKEVTPLRPSEQNRRKSRITNPINRLKANQTIRKEIQIPRETITQSVQEIPVQIEIKQEITSKFLYGVVSNNMIVTFKTESEAQAFMQGYKLMNSQAELKIIHIDEAIFKEDNNG